MSITHTNDRDQVTIRAPGSSIQVLANGDPVGCSGDFPPHVDDVSDIRYTNLSGRSDLTIEEPDRLAPGLASEGEGSEIEIAVFNNHDADLEEIVVQDADGQADTYTLGHVGISQDALNANPSEPNDGSWAWRT